MPETILKVENLYKLFPTRENNPKNLEAIALLQQGVSKEEVQAKLGLMAAVTDVSFSVERGQIFTLIGLSGSGKSTIIRCLNMLQPPTAGHIYFYGQDVTSFSEQELLNFRRTKVAMVFQNFGLMSHRNVLENVCYGLEVRGMPLAQREAKGLEMLELVGLSGSAAQAVKSLSGGMKQRVGIARALANDPDILLMDEAFSALDPLVRNDLQFELLRIQEKMGKTIIFITHDINEAFKLGSKVGILRDGRMVQVAAPEEMLAHPADSYVKNFINCVDSSRVICVRNIVSTPSCLVKENDGAHTALKSMRINGVSSAYVVDEHMRFVGIVTLDQALAVRDGRLSFAEALVRDTPVITNQDTLVADIVPLAATTPFPLAVVDDKLILQGIVTKAAVLSSICS
ncbi:MAG: betaine/proline/choline family ABC transporter ATP-binding protein [Acidaminococcaceae bacterium]